MYNEDDMSLLLLSLLGLMLCFLSRSMETLSDWFTNYFIPLLYFICGVGIGFFYGKTIKIIKESKTGSAG